MRFIWIAFYVILGFHKIRMKLIWIFSMLSVNFISILLFKEESDKFCVLLRIGKIISLS